MKTIPFYRRKPLRYVWKIAVAGLVAGVVIYLTGILSPRPPLALAEIASKFRDARTITYTVTVKSPELKKTLTMKYYFKEPAWLRGFKGTTTNESLGSLVALVDGRNVPLSVGYHKVSVDIRDQIARTVIEESFLRNEPIFLAPRHSVQIERGFDKADF